METSLNEHTIQRAIESLKNPPEPRTYYLTAPIYDQMKELGMCVGGLTRLEMPKTLPTF